MLARVVEYVFFFAILAGTGYLVWRLIEPFAGALALAAIIVTICYPMYERVLKWVPRKNKTIASLVSVLLVLLVVVAPLVLLSSFILREARSVYTMVSNGATFSFAETLSVIEATMQRIIPSFTIDIATYVQQLANFIASNIDTVLTGTASALFLFFIALISTFYFFRDGREFTKFLIQISPLPDDEDEKILRRLAVSVRSVAMGTVLLALIQGTLTAIGLSIFGFERAILWGCVAAIGALVPGIGTSIVFVPAIIYLLFGGEYISALGVAVWGSVAVGLIDNIVGPKLMSRGNKMHPFLILVSVLGGIALLGPIGFILGPVFMSLFAVLLELYNTHIVKTNTT